MIQSLLFPPAHMAQSAPVGPNATIPVAPAPAGPTIGSGLGSGDAGRVTANQGTVAGEAGMPLQGTPQGVAPQAPPGAGGSLTFMFLLFGLLMFMIFMSMMAGRKEKKRRAELLSSLQTNDRVQTIGGVIGTIVELRDDEVVLRVDESTNTRIRFAKAAVQQVLSKGRGGTDALTEAKSARTPARV